MKLALVFAMLLLTGCAVNQGSIKIGVINLLSGNGATYGEPMMKAEELALNDTNTGGWP